MRGWTGLLLIVAMAGCRHDMVDQPRYEPLEPGSNLVGMSSARSLIDGTVAIEEPRVLSTLDTGMIDGKLAVNVPFPVDRSVLIRGQERYAIFCTPCHGGLGNGRGIIVQRGFSPPPSFHDAELREAPIGHFFDVITHGHGAMYSYASRISSRDRWCIAAFIRALQLSQNVHVSELDDFDRSQLGEAKP